MKRALFPGTFNPFTIGHYDIVIRGLQIFDEIIIAIGSNNEKPTDLAADQRCQHIKQIFANIPTVKVEVYNGLTADFAREVKATHILRGVRNTIDFEYERNLADINRNLAGIETVLIYAQPQYSMVSSTMVRDLMRLGKDYSAYVPQIINKENKKEK